MAGNWLVGVDVGGTFTDLVASQILGDGHVHLKVATTPKNPAEGFLNAIDEFCRISGSSQDEIAAIFHGTTLVTNAIIERRLARTALVTTRGFRDVLEIGRHWRSDLYDPDLEPPEVLVPRELRLEVDERLSEDGTVVEPMGEKSVTALLEALRDRNVESVAIALLHSAANDVHETELAQRLRSANGARWFVSASSGVAPEPREYERTATTVLNAALMPLTNEYLVSLEKELDLLGQGRPAIRGERRSPSREPHAPHGPKLFVTSSNGGALTPGAARRRPVTLAQSGPVGGVRSCLELAASLNYGNVIGLDMGGTSADVALIEDGEARVVTELEVGELPVRTPSIKFHSIGAGGGTIAWIDKVGALRVGPRSAGASPGPACYGFGGDEPTVTDCHLVLGRIPANQLLGGFLRLDVAAARAALSERVAQPLGLSVAEAAQGVLDVVNAKLEGAIRVVLRQRGNDPRDFALIAFGGAGPLHAVELASRLAISTVMLPCHPGTFSALGLLTSDLRQDFALSGRVRSDSPDAPERLRELCSRLEASALEQLGREEEFLGELQIDRWCDVRYVGQAYEVAVPFGTGTVDAASFTKLVTDFHRLHERAYAFSQPDDPCEVCIERLFITIPTGARWRDLSGGREDAGAAQANPRRLPAFFNGSEMDCDVVDRSQLTPGDARNGPCIVVQQDSTALIPPGVTVRVSAAGDLLATGIPAT
jgi:N-methylhydantoinase A